MADRHEPASSEGDRPLVTFGLIGFNQGAVIREAIEGAFAQDYEPLEIILSDDCSPDGTFAIMQEMAAAYEGPHRVIARRNPINYGTAMHMQAIAEEMSGELLVVAAGDDISCPERSAKLVSGWLVHRRPPAIFSTAVSFGALTAGGEQRLTFRHRETEALDLAWFAKHRRNPIIAPAAAYSRAVFDAFPPLLGGSIMEDGPLCVRSLILGTVAALDEDLVRIRTAPETGGTGYTIDDAKRWNRLLRSRIISQFNQLNDLAHSERSGPVARRLRRYLRRNIRGLGACVVEGGASPSWGQRLSLFFRIAARYPQPGGLVNRAYFALSVCYPDARHSLRKLRLRRRQ